MSTETQLCAINSMQSAMSVAGVAWSPNPDPHEQSVGKLILQVSQWREQDTSKHLLAAMSMKTCMTPAAGSCICFTKLTWCCCGAPAVGVDAKCWLPTNVDPEPLTLAQAAQPQVMLSKLVVAFLSTHQPN